MERLRRLVHELASEVIRTSRAQAEAQMQRAEQMGWLKRP